MRIHDNHGHGPHRGHGHGPHHGHGHGHGGGLGYYAVVEKHGTMFFSGEIPGVSFTRVMLCNSYDELIQKITRALSEQMWTRPQMMSYADVAARNPGKEIVQIHPTSRF